MKMKKMWYTLIPAVLFITAARIYQKCIEFSDDAFWEKNSVYASYATAGIVILMFALLFIMAKANKKTLPVYNHKSNSVAGITVLLTAFVLVVDIGCYLPEIFVYKQFGLMVVDIVFSCLASAALFMLSWLHISGKNPTDKLSLFMLTIPFWCGVRLFNSFVSNSTRTVLSIDILELFIYIFLTMFLFSAISVISMQKIKNPIKSCMLFGLPLVALVFAYLVSAVINIVFYGYTEGYYIEIIKAVEYLFFASYALLFMVEVTKFSYLEDEVEIVEAERKSRLPLDKQKNHEFDSYENQGNNMPDEKEDRVSDFDLGYIIDNKENANVDNRPYFDVDSIEESQYDDFILENTHNDLEE